MAKVKKQKEVKKQQPISKGIFRPVDPKTDTWCSFKKKDEISKAPYGYVAEVVRDKKGCFLPEQVSRGYIVRSKLINGTFYVQFIPKNNFFGAEPNYVIFFTKNEKRRIWNVINTTRPKKAKRPMR